MDENKKIAFIHYFTEFILVSIGLGILFVLLFFNDFKISINVLSLWVFFFNGILFTYWAWKSKSKVWEKFMAGTYFVIVEIIIASSFTPSQG
tara:strand:+ start:221 stop:496 length:276 start_codon:yes stop_codon:yes gene_type:complete